ncbi:MAG: hydantoinase B/oxoprolinase family protein [Thermoplasmatales archaeon]|nr:hydantoinase B/oxoprolinase family protein [Thermoplasmatales archaeon]MCW6170406.1 hydantoinase B/oxoprolinase family protein [Thermoplasmatales archaeon]
MKNLFTFQVISNTLYYASEEMGIALRNSAYSPNIKERMDHSAAIFDDRGHLLAQAEHIPVHLGSLPWGLKNTLEYIARENIEIKNGDMILVNNPYISGTHLNDVTLIRPIFFDEKLVAFAANKAHHSDIGGKVPGSINFDGKSIFEEGFIINPVMLIRGEEFDDGILSMFSSNSRNPYERIGDLKAQVAANYTGERRVIEVIRKYGISNFTESIDYYLNYAEALAKSKLRKLKNGKYSAVDYLEAPDGRDLRLSVTVSVGDNQIEVNYDGTDAQVEVPLNAVLGVTISGVFFVFRSIMGEDVPVNDGTFRMFSIKVPSGTILNPTFPAPVSGGNVETSQRNADLLYLALSKADPAEIPAASGGSMNNIMMGGFYRSKSWAFYETIGVGLGGKLGKDGVDGIHSNMTNTMNTPIEEIERNMPIVMKRYEFRENSSGPGRYRGGSGIIRSFGIREGLVTVTVLSERERHKPWGLQGGFPGESTEVRIYSNGKSRKGHTKGTYYLKENEIFEIRTAGGGGYGSPAQRSKTKVLEDLDSGIISKKFANTYYKNL